MKIGDKIRYYRKARDIKAQTICDNLGISQSTYSKIENDKYKIDIVTLKKIANELEIDIDKLISEDKISICHTNNENSTGGSGIIVTNNVSDKLNKALEDQIEVLKELNNNLKTENFRLNNLVVKLQNEIKKFQ